MGLALNLMNDDDKVDRALILGLLAVMVARISKDDRTKEELNILECVQEGLKQIHRSFE